MNPAKAFSLLSPLLFVPLGFPSLSEKKTSTISVHTIISYVFPSLHLLCFSDRSFKLQKLCPGSSVTTNGLSLRFMSDMSDVTNVIMEAHTEKGSLALKAHWLHKQPH